MSESNISEGNDIVMTQIAFSGKSDGLIKVTLDNWNGSAFTMYKNNLKNIKREELNRSCLYFLIGKDEQTIGYKIYIGETGDFNKRIVKHSKDKDFWTECVVFVGDNLTKTKIKWLEGTLYKELTKIGRVNFITDNKNSPNIPKLMEKDIISLTRYKKRIYYILQMLKFRFAIPLIKVNKKEKASLLDYTFYLKRKYCNATMQPVVDGFKILKNSIISLDEDKYKEKPDLKSLYQKRDMLEQNNKLCNIKGLYTLLEDIIFNSVSSAGAFVTGRSSNGQIEWKTKTGIQFKQIDEKLNLIY